MKDYAANTNAYNMYYPEHFEVTEDDGGRTAFTNTETGLSVTISTYQVGANITDLEIMSMLSGFFKDNYGVVSEVADWNSYKTKFDNLVNFNFHHEGVNWQWYGISKGTRVLIFSINKETDITADDQNLIRYMIDSLDIH